MVMTQGKVDYEWIVNFELEGAGLVDGRWSRGALSLTADRASKPFETHFVYGTIGVTTHSPSREAAKEEVMGRVEEFLDILAVGCPMVSFFSGFPRIRNESVVCTNEKKIAQAAQLPPGDSGFRLSLTLDFKSPILTEEWTRWRSLDTLHNAALLRQLTRFYRIGRSEDDAYQKLFNFWISFNALYRELSAAGNDKDKIKNFVTYTTQNDPGKIAKVIDPFRNPAKYVHGITPLTLCLAELNATDVFDALIKAGLPHSQELSNQMASPSRAAIEEALLCIYDMRNDYFHGHLTPTDIDSRRSLVYVCCVFLDYMLQWGINCYLHDEAASAGLTL
jgi:hypothetical protein